MSRDALLGTYAPPDTLFVSGEGSWMLDDGGRRFLDFTSGIAVNALGHASPVVRDAVMEALDAGLVHTSNLYRTGPAESLAAELVAAAFPGKVFFCNSGAEANEAAFKIARKWAGCVGGPAKHEIVAFRGSFHGRLFGSLAATDRPGYRQPFEPLMPGVRFADVGDLAGLAQLVDEGRTAAVILEPIQGEGGVQPVPPEFLRGVRALCSERNVALVLDEIQCGLGRTGRLFAFEEAGIVPDVLTLAKPLAGGLPMGAVLAGPDLARAMAVGDHGTTFGGGPLVAGVARAVLATVSDPAFLAEVRRKGALLEILLEDLVGDAPRVVGARGRGLMWGVVLEDGAAEVVGRARDAGLLVVSAGPTVVRLLPALNVTDEELERGVAVLREVLA